MQSQGPQPCGMGQLALPGQGPEDGGIGQLLLQGQGLQAGMTYNPNQAATVVGNLFANSRMMAHRLNRIEHERDESRQAYQSVAQRVAALEAFAQLVGPYDGAVTDFVRALRAGGAVVQEAQIENHTDRCHRCIPQTPMIRGSETVAALAKRMRDKNRPLAVAASVAARGARASSAGPSPSVADGVCDAVVGATGPVVFAGVDSRGSLDLRAGVVFNPPSGTFEVRDAEKGAVTLFLISAQ